LLSLSVIFTKKIKKQNFLSKNHVYTLSLWHYILCFKTPIKISLMIGFRLIKMHIFQVHKLTKLNFKIEVALIDKAVTYFETNIFIISV